MGRFGLLRFGLKAGVMSSALYLTIHKGVWKDNTTTSELYSEIQKNIKPYMKPIMEQVPFEIPKLPQTGDMVSTAKTAWNKGVMASCLFLIELPDLTWSYIKKGSIFTYDKICKELEALNNTENKNSSENKNASKL